MRTGIWAWLLPAVVLIALGLFVVAGLAGTIVLACGCLALFGAGVHWLHQDDPRPPEERRLPAGHSGL
jgi:hypothetical protein